MLRPLLVALACSAAASPPEDAAKDAVCASIDEQAAGLTALADRIWGFAETALRETRSAALLADHAEQNGFTVERGVAGLPTAFVATYGEGRPVIGLLGEYDALPGISQKAEAARAPLEEGAAGHGCGHNLFGAGSLGAAIALKERIAAGELQGTVKFFGTPAEESVGGKLYMLREGLFDGLDVALAWHPSDETRSDTGGTQALADLRIEFRGKAAHAAYDPWNGRSAADASELFTHGMNLMREHVKPTVRIHYVVTRAGDVPNVVPERADVWCWLRDSHHADVDRLIERTRDVVNGAALAAGVTGTMRVTSGDYEMLVNVAGQRLLQENLERLGPIAFDEREQAFAKAIQVAAGVEPTGLDGAVKALDEAPGAPEGGSTDVADVSWNVPVIHLSATTAPAGAPWHAWPVVACAGTSIGHKGMLHAARALAMTAVDLFRDRSTLEMIRAEFERSTRGVTYRGYIGDAPPPLPE